MGRRGDPLKGGSCSCSKHTWCINLLPKLARDFTGVCPGEAGQHGAVAAEIARQSRIVCIMVKNGKFMQQEVMAAYRERSSESETQWVCWDDGSGVKAFAVRALGPEFRSPDAHINARQVWYATCAFSLRMQSIGWQD